ncbi:MAG TPA: hypothetical protein DCO77_07180 [Nitrospiraceae bacterium]|nr:hypothetical protein [Nitrospiraceae bacterium]
MKKHLAESFNTVNANIILILLLSLVSIYIFPGKMFLLAASSLVAQIFLYPAIWPADRDTV